MQTQKLMSDINNEMLLLHEEIHALEALCNDVARNRLIYASLHLREAKEHFAEYYRLAETVIASLPAEEFDQFCCARSL